MLRFHHASKDPADMACVIDAPTINETIKTIMKNVFVASVFNTKRQTMLAVLNVCVEAVTESVQPIRCESQHKAYDVEDVPSDMYTFNKMALSRQIHGCSLIFTTSGRHILCDVPEYLYNSTCASDRFGPLFHIMIRGCLRIDSLYDIHHVYQQEAQSLVEKRHDADELIVNSKTTV
ncbi:hypothetical protein T03_12405 [Trichinella britovi]|uniref:Uncharacterized protein n=1 Tax=Trichinella britovi TaxID=45882 RepID=A0A0V1CQX4_TRIBR|nr:hypothetical protein T03_12405 [Trichinella britovi]